MSYDLLQSGGKVLYTPIFQYAVLLRHVGNIEPGSLRDFSTYSPGYLSCGTANDFGYYYAVIITRAMSGHVRERRGPMVSHINAATKFLGRH